MERKIGEVFEFKGKKLRVEAAPGTGSMCSGCYFDGFDCREEATRNKIGKCFSPERTDYHDVRFRVLSDEKAPTQGDVRAYNVGNSDYSKHTIQPWDMWIEYRMNPFDADIQKRLIRKKTEAGMTPAESRIMDYKKIIHICQERIRQLEQGVDPFEEKNYEK